MTLKLYIGTNEWYEKYSSVLIGAMDNLEEPETKLIKNEMLKVSFVKVYDIKKTEEKRIFKKIEKYLVDVNKGFYTYIKQRNTRVFVQDGYIKSHSTKKETALRQMWASKTKPLV